MIAEDFNKDIKDIFIIDNTPHIIEEQDNVFMISPWFIGGDKYDNELMNVLDEVLKLDFAEVYPRA